MTKEKITPAEKVRRAVAENRQISNLVDKQAREQIQQWLDNSDRDYQSGVLLFGQYSRNKGLFYQFNRKQQSQYLFNVLSRMVTSSTPLIATRKLTAITEHTAEFVQRTAIDKSGKINPDDLPEELKQLYNQNTDDYKLLRAVHEKMKQAPDQHKRAENRAELALLDDAIAERWKIIDTWVESGKMPEKQPDKGGSSLDAKAVTNYRTYIKRGIDTISEGTITDVVKLEKLKANIKQRYDEMITSGNNFAPETINKLKELAIIDG